MFLRRAATEPVIGASSGPVQTTGPITGGSSTAGARRTPAGVWRLALALLVAFAAGIVVFETLAGTHARSLPLAHHRLALADHPRSALSGHRQSVLSGHRLRAPGARPSALAGHLQDAPATGSAGLPLAAQGAVSSSLGAERPGYRISRAGGGFAAHSPTQRFDMRFDNAGVQVSERDLRVGLEPEAIGFGSAVRAIGTAGLTANAEANRVTYTRAGFSAWYSNGPLGVEQGFTISHAPAGDPVAPLTLAIGLSGNAHASLARDGQSLTLSRAGASTLHYDALTVTDDRGHTLRSWLQLQHGRLLLRVDARGASYPLRIDPLVRQGERLSDHGQSVALSADGKIALIGGGGPAAVFVLSEGVWSEQATLTEDSGSVALSGDGETALIGRPALNKAFVFVRSGSTWTQQAELTGAGATASADFGESLALSAEGNTALVGAPEDEGVEKDEGAVWVFARSGSTWTQQGEKLTIPVDETQRKEYEATGQGPEFGFSVALSGDGNTALIGSPGAPGIGEQLGWAWVFTRSGETWSQGTLLQQGTELGGALGYSVALSADGDTALVGEPGGEFEEGDARIFSRSESGWSKVAYLYQEPGELIHGELIGYSVALSPDGNVALVGTREEAVYAAFVYARSGTTWQEREAVTLEPEERVRLGPSVALSNEGDEALITSRVGGVWALGFVLEPPKAETTKASSITHTSATLNASVNPDTAEVTGCEFEYGTSEAYGSSVPCSSLPGLGSSRVAVSASVAGLVSGTTYHFRIVATNAGGTSYGADQTFTTTTGEPPLAVTEPASSVTKTVATLNGTVMPDGQEVTSCEFEYGVEAVGGRKEKSTSVACSSLPGSGSSPVAVSANISGLSSSLTYYFRIVATTAGGTSYGAYVTFRPGHVPKIMKLSTGQAPASGGTLVTITGVNFSGATAVQFGSTEARTFKVESATSIVAETPVAPVQRTTITVTTPGGTASKPFKLTPAITGVSPTSGPEAGGTSVTVTGSFVEGQTTFEFGKTRSKHVTCISDTTCTVTAPPHAAGTVDVTAVFNKMASPKVAADQFTYE
jgi:phage gpG-like protein